MKKSRIIGGIVVLAVIAAAAFAIFWPKSPVLPGSSEENPASESSELPQAVESSESTPNEASPTTQSPAPLDANASPKMKKIENFLQLSRLRDEFKAMDGLLEAQLEQIQDAAELSAADREELENLKSAVSSERLLENVTKLMDERFDEKDLDKLNKTYEEPLMANLQEAKARNQTPEGQKAMVEEYRDFKEDKIAPDMVAQLKEYDKRSGGTENTMKMIKNVSEMAGSNSKDPKAQKEAAELNKTMYKAVEQANLFTNYYSMKNNSPQEVATINSFVAEPVVQKMNSIQQEVITGAIQEMSKMVSAKAEQHEHDGKKTKTK